MAKGKVLINVLRTSVNGGECVAMRTREAFRAHRRVKALKERGEFAGVRFTVALASL